MKLLTGIALTVLAAAAWSQNDRALTPRQLFLTNDPPVAKTPPQKTPQKTSPKPPVFAPLVLKYTILQSNGDSFQQVDADKEFHSGDRIRLSVAANAPAYLYIVLGGSSGQWRVLFPSKDIAGGKNRVDAHQPYTIPPESDPPFVFDETVGTEKVFLVLSRSPEADLEKLIYEVANSSHTIPDPVIEHVRDQVNSRDLVFEKVDTPAPDGKQEKAVYAATKDQTSNARLFVDLKLVHK